MFRSEKVIRKGLKSLGIPKARKTAKVMYRKQYEKLLPGRMVSGISESLRKGKAAR